MSSEFHTTRDANPLNTYAAVIIFCLSLFLFTWDIRSQEITSFDSRFYLFVLEMWHNGPSWFPTTYHQPYADYSATSTFLIYLLAKLTGGVNKLVAVFPSAVMAALTVTLTYLIGSLQQKRWGWYAALLMLLTIAFFKSARSISLDMYPTVITACCFYLIYSADLNHTDRYTKWIYPLLIISFAFRGPIGLVIPTGVICAYYLQGRQFKKCLQVGGIALLLLIICSAILLLLAYHTGGASFMHDVLHMQILGRVNNQDIPITFYFTDALLAYTITYPLALLVSPSPLAGEGRGGGRTLLLKLLTWTLIILIGMSIPGDKKIRYILPLSPALALLASYPLIAVHNRYLSLLHRALLILFFSFPSLMILLIEGAQMYAKHHFDFHPSYSIIVFFLMSLQLLNIFWCYRYHARTLFRNHLFMSLAALSFVLTFTLVYSPIETHIDQAQGVVHAIEQQRLRAQANLIFYRENPDGLPIKYLINMPHLAQPQFINDPQQLAQLATPTFIITKATNYAEFPKELLQQFHVLTKDKLGHVPIVVLTRNKETK